MQPEQTTTCALPAIVTWFCEDSAACPPRIASQKHHQVQASDILACQFGKVYHQSAPLTVNDIDAGNLIPGLVFNWSLLLLE